MSREANQAPDTDLIQAGEGGAALRGSWALTAIALLFCLPDTLFRTPAAGLDGSWAIALHLAVERGLRFGHDLFFTFGPLGVVTTRLPIGPHIKELLLCFDAFFLLNVLACLQTLFASCRSRFGQGLCLAGVVLHSVVLFRFDGAFTPLLFTVYWLERRAATGAALPGVFALWWAAVALFVKPHIGCLGLMFCFAWLVGGSSGMRRVAWFGFTAAVPLVLAAVLRVDLVPYLSAALSFATGYPDAMWNTAREFHRETLFAGACSAAVIVFLLLGAVGERRAGHRLRYLMLAGVVFLLWRQGAVRADGHVRMVANLLLPVAALCTLVLSPARWAPGAIAAVAFFAQFAFGRESLLAERWQARIEGPRAYIAAALSPGEVDEAAIPKEAQLSPELVAAIGGRSVDFLPWELSPLYYYRLQFAPRGVLQTYAAYTPWLDMRSALGLESARAPELLVVHSGAIDRRSVLAEEPETKLRMLQWYDPLRLTDDHLLLARRNLPLRVERRRLASGTAELGETIRLPAHRGPLLFAAVVSYSAAGQLRRELTRPPELHVVVRGEKGEELRARAVLPMLRAGVLISPMIGGKAAELPSQQALFGRDFGSLEHAESVQVDSRSQSGFEKKFRWITEEWSFPDAAN